MLLMLVTVPVPIPLTGFILVITLTLTRGKHTEEKKYLTPREMSSKFSARCVAMRINHSVLDMMH